MNIDELENRLIELAFAEDIGDGDHTTLCCIPEDATGSSHLLIKEDGILAGVEVAKNVFAAFDPTLKVEVRIPDGSPVKVGDIAMVVVTNRTSDAEYYATDERYCHNDSPVCGTAQRYSHPHSRYP